MSRKSNFFEQFDARIRLICETNTREMTNIDPQTNPHAPRLLAVDGNHAGRSAKGDYHWTATLYPTQAHAMEAEMSLEEYEDFVFKRLSAGYERPGGLLAKGLRNTRTRGGVDEGEEGPSALPAKRLIYE